MLNSTTLEVAIGMALVYLVLSLFCTAINEAIAGFFGSRARNLEKGIKSLFTGGLKSAATDAGGTAVPAVTLAQAIYDHGLIQSLYRSTPAEKAGTWFTKFRSTLPSYIPSPIFASTLFDVIFPNLDAVAASAAATPDAAADQNPAAPQQTGLAAAPPVQQATLTAMLNSLRALPDSKAKEAISTLVKQAGGDIARTRKAFEDWYDASMDRAAGWYKRKTQKILFVLGLVIALGLNVDSVALGRALWISPAIRSYTVATAEQYAHANTTPNATASNAIGTLQSLTTLPIGWTPVNYHQMKQQVAGLRHPHKSSIFSVFLIILGWLATAIAMTLGAPFWFDTLNQFMVIRSTIKPGDDK